MYFDVKPHGSVATKDGFTFTAYSCLVVYKVCNYGIIVQKQLS